MSPRSRSRSGGVPRPYLARALSSLTEAPTTLPDLISHAWRDSSSSSGAGAERPPHTTVPPPWDARFRGCGRTDGGGGGGSALLAPLGSESTRSPGHVLAGRKAPPITRPSGRAQEDPELAPSGWPAHQAQPLPWLFPNFRACGAPSSPPPLSYPPATLFSPSLAPSSLPSPLPSCNPARAFRLSLSLPRAPDLSAAPRRCSLLSSSSPPILSVAGRDGTPYLMRYRTPNGEIRTSSSGPQARSRGVSSIRKARARGAKGTLCGYARRLRLLALGTSGPFQAQFLSSALFYVLCARECTFLSTRLNFGNLRPRAFVEQSLCVNENRGDKEWKLVCCFLIFTGDNYFLSEARRGFEYISRVANLRRCKCNLPAIFQLRARSDTRIVRSSFNEYQLNPRDELMPVINDSCARNGSTPSVTTVTLLGCVRKSHPSAHEYTAFSFYLSELEEEESIPG
ncbi:hypothetical protein DBV15_00205 [Temnothorax longispinosus]|uniref:Uncharacterized protein n=1 Tax=Temnothorax longispinosus TaxID=300112 RepID=A0A4S2KHM6_9HYME|nr:hypothetical protein DBV15_00205 [Temnothorax longispinosus]